MLKTNIYSEPKEAGGSGPSHLISDLIIFLLSVLGLLLQPLCSLSAAPWCLGCVLHQALRQIFEVDHLRLQGAQILLLTPQSLQAFSAACLDGNLLFFNKLTDMFVFLMMFNEKWQDGLWL